MGEYFETALGNLEPGNTLLRNGFFAQGVGHTQAAVYHVQALVQTLSAKDGDDHLFPLKLDRAGGE